MTSLASLSPLPDGSGVEIIDQTQLPHVLVRPTLRTLDEVAEAIRTMRVRGAPLIGAAAAFGLALALRRAADDAALQQACAQLLATRPTAVNLAWAVNRVAARVRSLAASERAAAAWAEAEAICREDVELNAAIGRHGMELLNALHVLRGRPLQVMTHCNAGWLATLDWGTALAPVYMAQAAGLPLHVWVSETRPRNQGAALTAWELAQRGVPYTVIADNAAGQLMRTGQVDVVIVGADRVAANGDVANKIGTYLKALAAHDNGIPFYVAVPGPTIDWTLADGGAIPIEARPAQEVTHIHGLDAAGRPTAVRLTPEGAGACNPAFDVTPARLITGLITERGVCAASRAGLAALYPEQAHG
ncbi:MAG: S-methyl-5-thioribose-1-phosphate isomerase [Thiobacillaceae bacterium]|nr:S-methyl-5-thioribose-1-phosphate isomerase [Thiobacillaceae bacterium]